MVGEGSTSLRIVNSSVCKACMDVKRSEPLRVSKAIQYELADLKARSDEKRTH